MSLQFRVSEQVLKVDDARDATEAVVHKYDAFLNLLCDGRYVFQREAVRQISQPRTTGPRELECERDDPSAP